MKTKEVIKHVKSEYKILTSYLVSGIDNDVYVMLVHLTGNKPFKRPNWLGNSLNTYDAKRDKERIINEFINNPGMYGYGLLLGKQPAGFYLLCVDIDIDNDCKEVARKMYENRFKAINMDYRLEKTITGRYHIYIAVDEITDELKKLLTIDIECDAQKYVYTKLVDGKIEILGLDGPHVVTVYNGIINKEKPVFIDLPNVFSVKDIVFNLPEITEIKTDLNDVIINKLIEFYKLVRKYKFFNGWDIDRVVSGFCVKNQIANDKIIQIFERIYEEEYDEKATNYIVNHTKEKPIDLIPGTGTIIYQAKQLINSGMLSSEEIEVIRDLIKSVASGRKDKDDIELPDYLVGFENAYLISSRKKFKEKKGVFYREKYFVERNIKGVKEVWYIEIESDEPYAIFKNHLLINDPKAIGIKIEIKRLLQEKRRVYELIINDEFTFVPSFSFNHLEEIAIEIAAECSDLLARFDIPLFQDYFTIKMREYRDRNSKRIPCIISKTTGWSEDNKIFFHYDLNDERHELAKDNILFKEEKAVSFNQDKQHELVRKLLEEGKLLGVLLVVSTSSVFLKPLGLQPLTCILGGNPGAGKTTASYIATSLFYKSDSMLITGDTTKVGIERTLAALNSLPLVIDEGSLSENVASFLKHLIFSVASGRGRTRGKKDLTTETSKILSNVIWTSETTDLDEIKRSGAFRRVLYFSIEDWNDFTNLIDISDDYRIYKLYAGCGVDYIRYGIENLDKIKDRFIEETHGFGRKYKDIAEISLNIYAGLVILELYYQQSFVELRKTINSILEEAKRMFVVSRDNVVEELEQYLFMHNDHIGQVELISDSDGRNKYTYKEPTKEMYGEYDKTTQTYYITTNAFRKISKELEKERNLLINMLLKAGVLVKEKEKDTTMMYYSKILKKKIRVYKIKFPDNPLQPPEQSEPPPTEPTNDNKHDEPDDTLVEAFSKTTYEKPKPNIKEKEKAQQPKEKKKSQKPKAKDKETTQPPPEEKAQDKLITIEGNKIIVNEDKLDIYDVKPRSEIAKFEIKPKDIVPFNELVVGTFDIETTGLEETDQILAIAFDVYKGDKIEAQHRFYLDEYNDETKMVDAFLTAVFKSDIDVLTGYNIYGFDLKMINAKDQNNRLRFTDPVNISSVFIKNELQQGYNIIVDGKQIEVIDAYYLVVKYDNVARSIPAQNYDLKSVAKHFGIAKDDRVILGADEIRQYYYTNRKLFDEYLNEDVREAYEVFRKLAPPYYYLRSILPFNVSFFDAFRLSTAAVWERVLEYYYGKDYTQTLTADEKKDYEGGLVVVNRGLYKNVYKIDVASLYPNIMLNYWVYSRKDINKVALAILNEYTNLRLELKAKAKAGDKEADLIQSSLKILINSLYGFLGTGGYLFNDMIASAMVTAYGRRILKEMIAYIERNGGIIIECDTDGIYYSAVNGEEIYNGLKAELNKINFDIELEYKDCVMFASDKKNYILIKQDGTVIKKGSKFVGRDKNKLQTLFVVEYLKRYVNDPEKAKTYKQEMRKLIEDGKAYDWLKVTKKIAKNEVKIILDGLRKGLILEPGSIVTCAYENFRNGRFTFDTEEEKTYDVDYYLKQFDKLVSEIDSVIQSDKH